jgi:hypothetical protein
MAKGDEKKANQQREDLLTQQQQQNERLQSGPTPLEAEYTPISQNFQNQYQNVANRQMQDYSNIMGSFRDWREKSLTPTISAINAREPTKFQYSRDPSTVGRAVSGYTDFADTGGYSPQDIQELRARGISPIRAAYGNSMMQLDRQRSLQGGYSPNYTAATAQMQRELPQQLADATTNVNAGLADAIRQGKLAGLGGLTGIGGMEAPLKMRADELTEQALAGKEGRQLSAQQLLGSSIDMERGLYGTTPGATATFGNQAQEAYRQRLALEQLRGQLGSNYVDNQIRLLNPIDTGQKPWWQTALQVAGTAAPYVAMAASSRELKEDIKPVKGRDASKLTKYLKDLPLYTWKYKGDKTKHFGPIAEEFKDIFGIGDGKTIHLADVMGLTLAVAKGNA